MPDAPVAGLGPALHALQTNRGCFGERELKCPDATQMIDR